MIYDEFINRSGIQISKDIYDTIIEPMYMADKCDKYVFICKNFESLSKDQETNTESVFEDVRNDKSVYKIKYSPGCTTKTPNKKLREAIKDCRVLFYSYNNHYITGNDIVKFQYLLTRRLRRWPSIKPFLPVVGLYGGRCSMCFTAFFYDQDDELHYDRKTREWYDYRSRHSRFGLTFEKVETVSTFDKYTD